jgi:CBS domain-containing protein
MKVGTLCIRETVLIEKNDSLLAAAKLMHNYHVGALVVVEKLGGKNRPVGIVTDRDIALKGVAEERSPETAVGEILASELVTAPEEALLYDVLETMKAKGIRRIPVVDAEGYLAGILTMDDVIEFLTDEMKTISSLYYREVKKERKS